MTRRSLASLNASEIASEPRSDRELGHDAVRARFDRPDFFENFAGDHELETKVNAKSREFFLVWKINHTPPSRATIINFYEAIFPVPAKSVISWDTVQQNHFAFLKANSHELASCAW